MIKFAHLADLHLGAWREKTLTELNFRTFQKAIESIITNKAEFCIFAGDIFNTAVPPLDLVNRVVQELKKLKDANIPAYVIGGSHDYSNTGKSFLDLLSSAGMFYDVARWKYIDKNEIEMEWAWHNDSIIITGIVGEKNGLDKVHYRNLSEQNLPSDVYKIFVFHTTLNDLKPEFMKNYTSKVTSSSLPKGFDYYAGGHIHTYIHSYYDGSPITYTGPLFPNSVSELKREQPSFNWCYFNGEKTIVEREFLDMYTFETIYYESNYNTPSQIKEALFEKINTHKCENKIVLLEIKGIVEGYVADIGLIDITKQLYENGAMQVLKHTYYLSSSKIEVKDVDTSQISPHEIEQNVTQEILNDTEEFEKKQAIMEKLFKLDLEKQEEEKNSQYEERVRKAIEKCL